TVPNLAPSGFDENVACLLLVSPTGDHFVIIAGGGPIFTLIVDREGRFVKLQGMDEQVWLAGSGAAFFDGGDKLWVFGMERPRIVDLKRRTTAMSPDLENSPLSMAPLADGRTVAAFGADGDVALYDGSGKVLLRHAAFENRSFGRAQAGADDEVFTVAERAGFVDFYTKAGKFVRRVQTGVVGEYGTVAMAADGTTAAFGYGTAALMSATGARRWLAAQANYGLQDFLVAIAADGSRIAAAGPDLQLRSWSGNGRGDGLYTLRDGERRPRRLWSVAVSARGDVIAVADEAGAMWLVSAGDKRVLRVPLPARPQAVAALPDNGGFVVGLADGSLLRLGRDGATVGTPLKGASQWLGIDRLAVSPDGQSVVVIESDRVSARHLAWDGRVLAGPLRPHAEGRFAGAFFQAGEPVLIVTHTNPTDAKAPLIQLHYFGDPGFKRMRNFEAPR
ncbi:MAG: hypothetical protein KIT16_04195, partial [Rhodospirillaceae bacterium]|nr:hypothetical protein [Rhodospirillaceae bacterium]